MLYIRIVYNVCCLRGVINNDDDDDRLGWVRWLTMNNRRQSIGPKPDSRPRLERARYKYLTSCSCLLTPPHPSVTHTFAHMTQPDSSPPGLTQWACYKKSLSVWVQSRLDPCRKDTYIQTVTLSNLNRFLKFLHCWKAYEICHKIVPHYPPHLRNVATLPWEIKNSNFLQLFSRYRRKFKQIAFMHWF